MAEQSLQGRTRSRPGVRVRQSSAQGSGRQRRTWRGRAMAVSINAATAQAIQAGLSSRSALPTSVGRTAGCEWPRRGAGRETAGPALTTDTAIVRLRIGRPDDLSITFYRVDDLWARSTPHNAMPAIRRPCKGGLSDDGGVVVITPGRGLGHTERRAEPRERRRPCRMQLTNQHPPATTYSAFARPTRRRHGQLLGHLLRKLRSEHRGLGDTLGGGAPR